MRGKHNCGYCDKDLLRIADLRTDAKFCSSEHQNAYWKDARRSKRAWDNALNAIEVLKQVAVTDARLGDEALIYLGEIVEAAHNAHRLSSRNTLTAD